jgi:hypothetical protein
MPNLRRLISIFLVHAPKHEMSHCVTTPSTPPLARAHTVLQAHASMIQSFTKAVFVYILVRMMRTGKFVFGTQCYASESTKNGEVQKALKIRCNIPG